jgi:branched-chain amino acid transport system substrate-binding protein
VYDDTVATNNPNIFPVGASKNMVRMEAIVSANSNKQQPNGAFLYIPDEKATIPLLQAAARKAGGELVHIVEIPEKPPQDYDYLAQCRIAQEKNVGWMFLMLFPQPIASLAESCAKIGYRPTFITGYFIGNFLTVPALDGQKLVLPNELFNAETPAAQEFRQAVAKYDPSQLTEPYFGENSLMAWAALQLVAKAIETAQPRGAEVTRADVYRGLYSLKDETLGGLAPPLTYQRGKPTSIHCYFTARIKSGKLIATSAKPVCF